MDCKDGNDKTQTHGTDGYVANECGTVVKAPSAVILQQHRSCGHLAVLIYMINSTPPHKLAGILLQRRSHCRCHYHISSWQIINAGFKERSLCEITLVMMLMNWTRRTIKPAKVAAYTDNIATCTTVA